MEVLFVKCENTFLQCYNNKDCLEELSVILMCMKKGPFIFIGVLIITLFFILGIQFGKRVKTADEALQLLLTIAPSPSISPMDTLAENTFKEFTSSTCGFSFLYPADLLIKKTGSNSGELLKNNNTAISFLCETEAKSAPQATASIALSGIEGTASIQDDMKTVRMKHPSRNFTLELVYTTYYQTLIERTIEFNK